jgi:hypothetical protein
MATVADTDTIDAATGRARPLSDQEQKTRSEALVRALAEIAEMTDETDTDEIWADVFRGIDVTHSATHPRGALWEKWIEFLSW